MDSQLALDLLRHFAEEVVKLVDEVKELANNDDCIYSLRLMRIGHFLAPIVIAMVFYYYFRYLLIFNASKYEMYMRKRCEHFKKVSRQLKRLAKRYSNAYFCYLPMNHGLCLPRTHALFAAIKDVLVNANRPATRVLRKNLLKDLLHTDYVEQGNLLRLETPETEFLDFSHSDLDPLSEFNLDIMNCSRELIIQGVKDFDVMSTVYRVMETVLEESY